MEKTNTIRIEFTAEELTEIYAALNRLGLHYADKSETMQKILNDTATIEDMINPDYYFHLRSFVGNIQDRIYKAEKRLARKSAKLSA